MGKKRRILTRTTKFAKKYFEFLDKADSTDDDQIDTSSGRGDAFIDTLAVTDRNNQTVKLSGRLLGFKEGDKIQWSFDGETFKPNNGQVVTHTGTGLDKIKIDEAVEVAAVAGHLSVGSHTVRVRKLGETNEDLYKSADVSIRQHKITIGGLAAAFIESGDQISFVSAQLNIAGKKLKGVSQDAAVLGANSTNAIKYEVSTGAEFDAANTVKLIGDVDSITIAKNQNYTDTSLDHPTRLLKDAVTGAAGTVHTFTVKVTPFDSSGAELTDSAVFHTLTVTKDA